MKNAKTLSPKQQHIVDVWNEIEAEEPDISTERLIEMVCQRVGKDTGTVMDALEAEARLQKSN